MSDRQDEAYQCKSKSIKKKDDFKRKRTTIKHAKEAGIVLLPCEFCPEDNKKCFQSYPALYFHVRKKHPGETVTSTKFKPSKTDQNPVLKLKTILMVTDFERDEVQRQLIDLKQMLGLHLTTAIYDKRLVSFNNVGEKDTECLMSEVTSKAVELSNRLGFNSDHFKEAERGEIFRQYYTKIFPVNFGADIIRLYAKDRELSSKIYFQIVLMECLDQCLIDRTIFDEYQVKLWGEYKGIMECLKEYWIKWKSINKQILMEEYYNEEMQQEGVNSISY